MRATSKRCRQGRACEYGWRHTLGNRRMLEDPRTQESCRRRKALWKKKAPQAIFCALWHERRNEHRLRGSLSSNYATHFHHLLINLVLIWDFRRAVVANLAFFGLRRLYFTKPDGRRGQFGGNRSRTGPPPPFETRSEPAPAPARCGLPHAIGAGMSPRPPPRVVARRKAALRRVCRRRPRKRSEAARRRPRRRRMSNCRPSSCRRRIFA